MKNMQVDNSVIEGISLPCLQVDEHGIITGINDAAEKLTGYSKEAVTGKPHFEIFHVAQVREVCPLFEHSLKREQAFEVESMLRKADGEVITISSIGSLLYDEGRFVGGFEFFRDVSVLKKWRWKRKLFCL